MSAPWYSGDPSVNEEVAAELATLTPAKIGAASATKSIDAQTAAYTLVAADAGKIVQVTDASASALTVPPNSAVAFPIGTSIDVLQAGAGLVTVTAGAGVTVHSNTTLKMGGQWSRANLVKVATDVWVLSGEIAAS